MALPEFDSPVQISTAGTLIFKSHCYALRVPGEDDRWLDMDCSPSHLLDLVVQIEGETQGRTIIAVKSIGPVNS